MNSRKELQSIGYVERTEDAQALSEEMVNEWMVDFQDWQVHMQDGEARLQRQYGFPDFATALEFTRRVGELAEEVDHHPIITLAWGQVILQWWTHELGGLHRNDFVLAARSDDVYEAMGV